MGFPTIAPDIPTVVNTETLNTMGGNASNGHATHINKIKTEILAIAAKLGVSAATPADTPAPNTALVSDATSKSKWGQIIQAMLATGSVGKLTIVSGVNSATTTSTSFVTLPDLTTSYTPVSGCAALFVVSYASYFHSANNVTSRQRTVIGATVGNDVLNSGPTGAFFQTVSWTGVTTPANSAITIKTEWMTASGTLTADVGYRSMVILELMR